MVPDSTGLYVGLVGWCDIHCKFLSTFRGCVLPNESVCLKCRLRMGLLDLWGVYFMHFVLFFWMVLCPYLFCLCFVSCINYNKWDQYTDSIVNPLHMCLFGAMSEFVKSALSMNNLSSLIFTSSNQWIICHIWSVLYVVKCGECIVTYANHLTFGSI